MNDELDKLILGIAEEAAAKDLTVNELALLEQKAQMLKSLRD